MADYASQVSKHRDRVTKMLDRGPTLGEVGRAGLASVGRGRDFSTQLQAQRQATFGPEMMKLEMLREAQADEAATAGAAFEREKFGEEKRQHEGKQSLQRQRIKAEEDRLRLAREELGFKQTVQLAKQGNDDAAAVLKVFSELTEGASTESAASLWKKLYEGETQITAKNARQEIGKLASETLKTKPPARMFASVEDRLRYDEQSAEAEEVRQSNKTIRENASASFNAAQDTMFSTGQMLDLLEANPDLTGSGETFFTQAKTVANAFSRFLGDEQPFDISNQQQFRSWANRAALALKEKLPGTISNFEVQFMIQSAANLDNSPEANIRLMNAMRAVAERVIDYRKKLTAWERENEGRPLREFVEDYEIYAAENPIVVPESAPRSEPAPGLQDVGEDTGEALYDTFKGLPDNQQAVNTWYIGLTEAERAALNAYRMKKRQK